MDSPAEVMIDEFDFYLTMDWTHRVASGSKGHIARQKAKFSQTVNKFH
jgi:hypothetical protein